MKYCADTWFILKLFKQDLKAQNILREVRVGKDELIIPIIVIAESYKKLYQQSVSDRDVEAFIDNIEVIEKVSIIPIDKSTAKEAAKVSLSNNVPMLDSIVAATAKVLICHFVLSDDSDLKKLHQKKYIKIKSW
jgi:predicted nucleic acid-binding protein